MLTLQYFGHLMWRNDSLEKTLMLGKIEGRRRRGYRGWDGWMASLTGWTWVGASSGSWWWTGKPGVLQSLRVQRVGYSWATELTMLSAQSLQSFPTLCDLWTVAHQAPVPMRFSRQECWHGLPCPLPGDLPNPGIEPRAPALQVDSLPSEQPGKPHLHVYLSLFYIFYSFIVYCKILNIVPCAVQ